MSKVVAIFNVNEETLEEMESGSVENAFGWIQESGLFLDSYETYEDNEELPNIYKAN